MHKLFWIPILLLAFSDASISSVIINEINYNSSVEFNPEDWVELYNYSTNTVDISGWVFKDEEDTNEFYFPENTVLGPGEFIVLCENILAFTPLFPGVDNRIGSFDFGLSGGGELIRLYNTQGGLIDYLTYDDQPPWPVEPDGHGPTLELIDPSLPNAEPQSWQASIFPHGSPGQENGWLSIQSELPDGDQLLDYRLLPCYPNPFNPTTVLSFQLPVASFVKLEVLDINGRNVGVNNHSRSSLINGYYTLGTHKITFNASHLPSGIYFARLTVDDFHSTQKLLFIK